MSGQLKIYACSGVGSTSSQVAQDIRDAGWMRNKTLRKYLGSSKDGGCAEYFLYIFIPKEELSKYSYTIYKKREQQLKTYAYVRELFVEHQYGSEQDMVAIIRQGIEKTFGVTVEDVLSDIRAGKKGAIGQLTPAAIAAIVTAIISLVTTVISGIIQYCQAVNVAKYTAPSMEELEASVPEATDFTANTKRNIGILAALAGVGLFLFGSFKK